MESCDVLIVGGGPAGSSCAWALRRAGIDVVVTDKSTFPRDKVCAGWITPQVVRALELDRAEYAEKHVLQPFTGFATSLIGGREVQVDYGRVISYGIRRREFDHYLLDRSGARLRLGERVRQVRRSGDGWLVDEELKARLIVGAGGHFCPIARHIPGRKEAVSDTVVAQEMEIWLDPTQAARCTTAPERPELFFCRDLRGYGWCVRKGQYINIGLGRLNEPHLTTQVEHFIYGLKESGRIPPDLAVSFQGHAYTLYSHAPERVVTDGLLLVGDSAGLAYDESGEGIRPAIESGLLAAQTIIEARGHYTAHRLGRYESRLRERFGAQRRTSLIGRLPGALASFAAERLITSRRFARHVVIDRWFLHRELPALAA